MIDSHCHLEQSDYDLDRDEVIKRCKEELKAVVDSCCHPEHLELVLKLLKEHPTFIFSTVAIHPIHIKEFSLEEVDQFIGKIKAHREKFVGVGETGLDYKAAQEEKFREKQKQMFRKFIELSNELEKPLVIHSRRSTKPAVEILEDEEAEEVLMHFFVSERLLDRVINNGWHISINTLVLGNKKVQRIVKKTPLDRILLETDSPWLGGTGRNEPTSVKRVAKRIAGIKNKEFEEVWRKLGENSMEFFDLPFSF